MKAESIASYELMHHKPLRCALENIEKTKKKIVVIVDTQRKILGTVTDGDIRRGLILGLNLDSPISKFMNTNPTLVLEGEELFPYLKDLQRGLYRQIVVINKNRHLVNILSAEDLTPEFDHDKIAVIMAGGRGKRLGVITDDIPKPMLEVAGKPMIELIITKLRLHGYRTIHISVNYKKEAIINYLKDGKDFGVDIHYLEEEKPLGTAGSLCLLPKNLDKNFLVINADLVTNVDLFGLENQHKRLEKIATIGVKNYEVEVPFGVVQFDDSMVVQTIIEKPLYAYFISSGIYLFKPEVLHYIPHNLYLDMPDLFKLLIEKKMVAVFPFFESWYDVGRMEDLSMVREMFNV